MAAAHHEEMAAAWTRAQSHLYRGLMILAAVFVHLERGNPEGACIKFRKARDQLLSLRALTSPSNLRNRDHLPRLAGSGSRVASGRTTSGTCTRRT